MTQHNQPEHVTKVKIKKSQLFELRHRLLEQLDPFTDHVVCVGLEDGSVTVSDRDNAGRRSAGIYTPLTEPEEREWEDLDESDLVDKDLDDSIPYVRTEYCGDKYSKGEIYSINGRGLRKLWENRVDSFEVADTIEIEWVDDVTVLGFLREKMS